eukprot:XP_011682363.1 PREDICTED: uncharacterized protein LOC105446796 isoform X1 [Strongylocentrotus purpuratus]
MKTDLGWCVVGISSQKEFAVSPDDRIGFSHRLITCEILPELTESKTATKEKVMFSHNVTIKEEISPSSVLRIMKDDNPRNQWTLARVVDVYPSSDNHVRKVKLVMGDPKINSRGKRIFQQRYFERPIHKLILLVAHEDQGKFPDKEPQG